MKRLIDAFLKYGNGPISRIVQRVVMRGKLNYVKLSEGKPENYVRVRRGFEKMVADLNRPVAGFTHTPAEINGVKCEWVVPSNCDQDKVFVYFHGGGYHFGSLNTTRSIVAQLTLQTKTKGLMVEYRKAPEHQYPAPIEDAVAVYKFLLETESIDPKKIAFGGDSAGGGVAMGTLLFLRDNKIPLPACAVLLSPWVDHTGRSPTISKNDAIDPMLPAVKLPIYSKSYLGTNALDAPYASPIHHNLAGLPPLCIQVGEYEILLNDSMALAERAKADGVEAELEVFPGMFHVFQLFHKVLYTAQLANAKLATFIVNRMSS